MACSYVRNTYLWEGKVQTDIITLRGISTIFSEKACLVEIFLIQGKVKRFETLGPLRTLSIISVKCLRFVHVRQIDYS
jgi:hypothetical protein